MSSCPKCALRQVLLDAVAEQLRALIRTWLAVPEPADLHEARIIIDSFKANAEVLLASLPPEQT